MAIYDFRSDTVTLPTPEMMAAVAAARLGDSARGDDPTVAELERLGAALTGKDDALFVPSGTMANLAAVIGHDCRGGEVIVEAGAHIYNSEGGGLSVVAGAVARPVAGRHGVMDPADVAAAIRAGGDAALAQTRLICLENTHTPPAARSCRSTTWRRSARSPRAPGCRSTSTARGYSTPRPISASR